jgi:polyhydroxyalkanoate synthesis regulator phasin
MVIPPWIQEVLERFDSKTEPHNEVDIAQSLSGERAKHGHLSTEEWKAFLSEHSVFFFMESREGTSAWGTYFAPMVEWTQGETTFRNPDIAQLDAETITYWGERAAAITNPVMKARYADAAWDFAKVIANSKPNYECALMAIDGYVEATNRHFYTMEIEAVQWLVRALHLARSVGDLHRVKKVVDEMFDFYQMSLDPGHAGVWTFLFDNLYEEKKLISTSQEAKIISDLEAMLARLTVVGEPNEFDPYGAQAAAERLVQHYKKQNDKANVERVMKAYGGAFVTMAEMANPMLAMSWLQPVIERYEQEGMKNEAEELRLLQIKKSENIASDMKHYSVGVNVTKKDYDDLARSLIVEGGLSTTLGNVAAHFIPRVDQAKAMVQEIKKVAPLLSIIPITVVDRTGRPVAKVGTDGDAEGRLFRQLAQMVGFSQAFLSYVIETVIAGFQPGADDILAVLYRSPLFLESRRSILRDGLAAYLSKDHLNGIHVLVPQIEEMLRTLLALMGIPPHKSVPRHPGITDVKNMNDALGDPRVQEVLTENLWRYLTVLYIDRRGMNLRNDLAHGLVSAEAFNQPTADLVFHSLLALSLMQKQETTSQE